MPDELFRAAHFHNSAPNSDIAGRMPRLILHSVAVGAKRVPLARSTLILGAGHKGIKPLMCKHNVVYDLLALASKKNKKNFRNPLLLPGVSFIITHVVTLIAMKREVAAEIAGFPWSECQVKKLATSHCIQVKEVR